MLKVIEYKVFWIVKNDRARKVIKPIYKDVGKGAGLENIRNLKKQFEKQKSAML